MTRKTTEAYVAVLHDFATMLAPHIRPDSYMTDFERVLPTALQITYPEAISERWYFYYCQVLSQNHYSLRNYTYEPLKMAESIDIFQAFIISVVLFEHKYFF